MEFHLTRLIVKLKARGKRWYQSHIFKMLTCSVIASRRKSVWFLVISSNKHFQVVLNKSWELEIYSRGHSECMCKVWDKSELRVQIPSEIVERENRRKGAHKKNHKIHFLIIYCNFTFTKFHSIQKLIFCLNSKSPLLRLTKGRIIWTYSSGSMWYIFCIPYNKSAILKINSLFIIGKEEIPSSGTFLMICA